MVFKTWKKNETAHSFHASHTNYRYIYIFIQASLSRNIKLEHRFCSGALLLNWWVKDGQVLHVLLFYLKDYHLI